MQAISGLQCRWTLALRLSVSLGKLLLLCVLFAAISRIAAPGFVSVQGAPALRCGIGSLPLLLHPGVQRGILSFPVLCGWLS